MDLDLPLLGVYYVLVIFAYLLFEMIPLNYRPVLIEGILEASYPSSTTLLVLSVMPTLHFQAERRLKNSALRHQSQPIRQRVEHPMHICQAMKPTVYCRKAHRALPWANLLYIDCLNQECPHSKGGKK